MKVAVFFLILAIVAIISCKARNQSNLAGSDNPDATVDSNTPAFVSDDSEFTFLLGPTLLKTKAALLLKKNDPQFKHVMKCLNENKEEEDLVARWMCTEESPTSQGENYLVEVFYQISDKQVKKADLYLVKSPQNELVSSLPYDPAAPSISTAYLNLECDRADNSGKKLKYKILGYPYTSELSGRYYGDGIFNTGTGYNTSGTSACEHNDSSISDNHIYDCKKLDWNKTDTKSIFYAVRSNDANVLTGTFIEYENYSTSDLPRKEFKVENLKCVVKHEEINIFED